MLSSLYLLLLLLTVFSADVRAQEPTEPAAESTVITSSLTGATFVVEQRAPQAGVRKTRSRDAAATSAATRMAGLTPAQLGIVEKLNRADARRLPRLDSVVIPAAWIGDELAYSPFPQSYAWAAAKPTTIVVDQAAQAFAAYEFGRLVRWGPVSSGQGGKTPAGVFQLSWRSRGHHSSIDPTWYMEWYFNFIPSQGIAFHKYSLPGRAASHGCVRMLARDARWLFEWGEAARKGAPGTTVVVLGCPGAGKMWDDEDFLRTGVSLPESPPTAKRSCVGLAGGVTAASYRKAVR